MQTKKTTLAQLAELVDGKLVGDPRISVSGLSDPATAGAGELTFVVKPRQAREIAATGAAAVIVPLAVESAAKPLIRVKDPYLAAAIIHNHFLETPFIAAGISPRAHCGDNCRIAASASIGPMAVLGHRVRLGERVTIHPGAVLGDDVQIGDNSVIHANVTIYSNSIIGRRVIIHSGTVIGSDGFGYATDQQGHHVKRPHVGIVRIDDDVEIGANVCVDRGTFGKTWIKQGVKIDNLVQVAHNVVVGEHCLLVAQAGIAGSAQLGCNVVLGGQSAVNGHIRIGDRVMAAAGSGIHGNLNGGEIMAGFPAIPHRQWLRATVAFSSLPALVKEVRRLKKKVAELEAPGSSGGTDE